MAPPAQVVERTFDRHRGKVLRESTLILANYFLFVYVANHFAPVGLIADPGLHLVVSAFLVLIASTLLLGLVIFAAKMRTHRRLRIQREAKPAIVDALTRIARGEGQEGELRPLFARAPALVEELIAGMLAMQKGQGRVKLAAAAESCGLPAKWRRLTGCTNPQARCTAIVRLGLLPDPGCDAEFCKGLEDPEELVSVESARALIRSGREDVIEAVFLDLPRRTRLVRALLCEWLRKHSALLAGKVIPAMLQSGDRKQILTALEALGAWRRALVLPDLKPLLQHDDPEIREAVWRVLPYALGFDTSPDDLADALTSKDTGVRTTTLNAIARLRISTADSVVKGAMLDPDAQVALAASYAAAALGLRHDLERIAVGGTAPASACATEALEKYMMGRLER